eukprot:Hpha_TRINITY_DN15514_c6_g3::TRINITY_DN15514_c6_g3_i2::g.108364::m.108364
MLVLCVFVLVGVVVLLSVVRYPGWPFPYLYTAALGGLLMLCDEPAEDLEWTTWLRVAHVLFAVLGTFFAVWLGMALDGEQGGPAAAINFVILGPMLGVIAAAVGQWYAESVREAVLISEATATLGVLPILRWGQIHASD